MFSTSAVGSQAIVNVDEPAAANVGFNSANTLAFAGTLVGAGLVCATNFSKRTTVAMLVLFGLCFCMIQAICLTSVASLDVGVPTGTHTHTHTHTYLNASASPVQVAPMMTKRRSRRWCVWRRKSRRRTAL